MGATFRATVFLGVCGLAFVALALIAQATSADTHIPRIASCLDPRSSHTSPLASRLQVLWELRRHSQAQPDQVCLSIIGDEDDYRQARKITAVWSPSRGMDTIPLVDTDPPSFSAPQHNQCFDQRAGATSVKVYIADFAGKIVDCEVITL